MAKRVDPLKAKQAKQKKMAIGGAVLLLGLLGVQGPKTLKMLQGPQPVESAASTTPSTTTGVAPVTPPIDGTAAPAPSGAADLASVADSDAAPVAAGNQLATFERFASKDPFAQQALPVKAPVRTSTPNDGTASSASGGASEKPSDDKASEADGGEDGSTGGFTSGGSEPAAPALAETTSIAINGVAEDVTVEGAFPKDEPTFVLVSVAANGKSVEIGIAGGEYANGGETMKLALGKKLTLQNTADGSRYEIELRSIAGQPLPKKSG
jgi:hypothetical protein